MKIRFVQKLIDFIRIELASFDKKHFQLFYIGGSKHKNAGDIFNENIMEYFKIPYKKARESNANLFCVGSILGNVVNNKGLKVKENKCTIIGSGFIREKQPGEMLVKDVNILALRGKLSQERMEAALGKKIECLLADAGILASYMYIFPKVKKYKVGIIPHLFDKGNNYIKNCRLKNYSYNIIDIEQKPEKVFKDICECECILSSSLHGLIFADSYSIPNRQLILSDNLFGGDYKFRDYYSSYDMEFPEPFDLRNVTISDSDIDTIIHNYQDKSVEISIKQKELVKIFENLKIRKGKND